MNPLSYDLYLRGQHHGKTAEKRLNTANMMLENRINEIKKAQKRQSYFIFAAYLLGGLLSFDYMGGSSVIGIGIAFFMNLAAYHYGRYQFMPEAEMYNFNNSVARWESEGKPEGYSKKTNINPA